MCHCLGLGPVLGSRDFKGDFFASPLTFHPEICMLAAGHSTCGLRGKEDPFISH